jgi:hypothetical protein
MAEIVRTFVASPSAFRAELLDALSKSRNAVRTIETILTDDYKRKRQAWNVESGLSDIALREICTFVEDAIANGMTECKIVLVCDG